MRSSHHHQLKMRNSLLPMVFFILLLFMPSFTVSESCLPSWFRQTRSASSEDVGGLLNNPSSSASSPESSPTSSSLQKSLETNEIGEAIGGKTENDDEFPVPPDGISGDSEVDEDDEKTSMTSTPPTLPPRKGDGIDKKSEESVDELAEKEAEYEYGYDDEKEAGEALKYNEEATKEASAALKPAVRREIEKLKEAKCRDYCHHNATCHVEVIFRDDRISAVVPSCHCPHGWEGTRCDRHYVQAFYAPVSGRYNQSSTSAVPAFGFLVIMLIMFIAIVVYAYRRMSKRSDDTTYTMSHMCPPEAFTVLKTPNGRQISVHQCSTVTPPNSTVTPATRAPMRQAAVRNVDNSTARNNFFSILRSQGSIPSREINEDDTPKHYKSVPRVEVSAINYSGHIDFSGISFQSNESADVSKASATCPPAHFVIQMEEKDDVETNFRSPSRSAGEPGSPISLQPMIPPNS